MRTAQLLVLGTVAGQAAAFLPPSPGFALVAQRAGAASTLLGPAAGQRANARRPVLLRMQEKPAGDAAKVDAAKAAAKAAEQALFFSLDDDEAPAAEKPAPEAPKKTAKMEAQEARMARFDADLRKVTKRDTADKRTVDALDTRGVQLSKGVQEEVIKELGFDDSKIKAALRGEARPKEETVRDKLVTETGEELLFAEFPLGANISPTARGSGDVVFDPMNPPLPSELAAQEEESKSEADLPLVSELSTQTNQGLYGLDLEAVEDDALFRIQSQFDSSGGKVPGKVGPGMAEGRDSSQMSFDEIIARDRAAIKAAKASDRPLIEVDEPPPPLVLGGHAASLTPY